MKKSAMALVIFLVIGLTGLASSWAAVTVTITNPASGTDYLVGETIFLTGTGVETPSDFVLTGDDLEWYANGVFLGNGESQSWRPGQGTYRITLRGEKNGSVGVDEIEVTVSALTFTVNILSPASGGTYESGNVIVFYGEGEISQTGQSLSGSQLIWISDKDGQIGTGTYFTRQNLSPGTHLITLIGNNGVGNNAGIDTITITVTTVSIFIPQPITSGDSAIYDWAKNILYIPLLVGDTPYFLNLSVTDWTTDPLQLSLKYIGVAAFSPTAQYANFDFLNNTLYVPDWRVAENVSYRLMLKLTTNEDPFVFDLVGASLNLN